MMKLGKAKSQGDMELERTFKTSFEGWRAGIVGTVGKGWHEKTYSTCLK